MKNNNKSFKETFDHVEPYVMELSFAETFDHTEPPVMPHNFTDPFDA